jgi:WD40 repeat protein
MSSEGLAAPSIVVEGSAIGATLVAGNNNTIVIYGSEMLRSRAAELPDTFLRAPVGEVGANPYQALSAFDETSSHLFFGREELTGKLIGRLTALQRQLQAQPRMLTIMGPSGCGKSSIARAGIVPRLAMGDVPGLEHAMVAILQPGPHPVEALGLALARLATSERAPAAKAHEFSNELGQAGAEGRFDGLARLARMVCPPREPLIILVDQFEETWTQCRPADPNDRTAVARALAERSAFAGALMHAAAEPNGQVIVLLTLRTDFFGATSEFMEVNRAIAGGNEIVPVMSRDELHAAIAEPAKMAGHPLDSGTVSRLLDEMEGEDSGLPLLQFALYRIWEGFCDGQAASETLDALHGVGGALASRAEELFLGLPNERERNLVRRAFEEMVQIGEGSRDTRRRARLIDMVPRGVTEDNVAAALEPFVQERLVSKGIDEQGQVVAELAHEALIQHWQTLRHWIDERRADLRFGRRVQQAAIEWWDGGRPVGRLWRSPDLDLLQDYARRCPQDLTEHASEFLYRSGRERSRQQWIARLGVGAITVLFLVAAAFGIYSQYETRVAQRATINAEEQRNQALLQESQAVSILSRQATARGDAMTGMLAALEILPDPILGRNRPVSNAAGSALLDAWLHNRELADLIGHTDTLNNAVFSPDGKHIVTASSDGTARVWDLSGPHPAAIVLESHKGSVNCAVFSSDGKRVATASADGIARVWDLSGPFPTATVLKGHTDRVNSVAFSPDGKSVVTASGDRTARVWDLSGPHPTVTVLEGHTGDVYDAAFSPDGRRVVTDSSDGTARVWDLSGPRPTATVLEGHRSRVVSVAFSPDGKRVVTGSVDHTARVWDLSGPHPTTTVLKGHTSIVTSAAFSPDGMRVVTASFDHTARVWDLSGPHPTAIVLEGHTHIVSSAAFSPDGKSVLTASWDRSARVWDLSRPHPTATVLEGHTESLTSAAFSPDAKLVVTTSVDRTARVWDLSGPRPTATVLEGHTGDVTSATFSPDGERVLTASWDNTARVWDLSGPHPTATVLEGHTSIVTSAAFSPDGKRVLTASWDHTARVWDLSRPRPTATVLEGHTGGVNSAAFSPDGRRVVTASDDQTARVWDLSAPHPTATVLEGHSDVVNSAAFSPDGKRVLTTSRDRTARIWDLSGPHPTATVLEGHKDNVIGAAFSPDGKRVLTASWDNTARVWDLAGAAPTTIVLEGHTGTVNSAAFSPDGRQVVTASNDYTARVWDISGTHPTATVLEGHRGIVTRAAFSPDGKRVVTASGDGTARVWDLSGPHPIATVLERHSDTVASAAFSPDGNRVVSAPADHTARVTPVPLLETLVAKAKRSLTRCLTTAQREEFGLPRSSQAPADRYQITIPPCR